MKFDYEHSFLRVFELTLTFNNEAEWKPMRQSQSNRRGRGRGRKAQNPLTKNYESNGPDVKIRGTAAHISEKYISLARDALASSDVVRHENYLQHAEHYNRIIMAAQENMQAAAENGDDAASGQEVSAEAGQEGHSNAKKKNNNRRRRQDDRGKKGDKAQKNQNHQHGRNGKSDSGNGKRAGQRQDGVVKSVEMNKAEGDAPQTESKADDAAA